MATHLKPKPKPSLFVLLAILHLLSIKHPAVLFGQSQPATGGNGFDYEVKLVPLEIDGLTGIHSFAYAGHEGKLLLVGGRTDGLHARQPFASFPQDRNNRNIIVVDPSARKAWSASLDSLETVVYEHLQSTNLNFEQWGDTLYIIGGYAYSETFSDHITFPRLTTFRVSKIIEQVKDGLLTDEFFGHLDDERFAVAGGQLGRIGNRLFLVGGNRFDGRYNPRGFDTYTQTYTTMIQKFTLDNSGSSPVLIDYEFINDPDHLRRRDYNLVPYLFTDGRPGYLISSGVFRTDANLPFLYPVEIDETGYRPVPDLNQLLSHYHSPKFAFFDSDKQMLHMVFLGGLAQYYYDEDVLVQDNRVPFVNTISRVSRDADGRFSEHLLTTTMPGFKGTSAEFIPNPDLMTNETGVILLDGSNDDQILVGYMAGGIVSPILNPFEENRTHETYADPTLYEIWLLRNASTNLPPEDSPTHFQLLPNYPNPFNPSTSIRFALPEPGMVTLTVYNLMGEKVAIPLDEIRGAGWHDVRFNAGSLTSGVYIIRLAATDRTASQKITLIK